MMTRFSSSLPTLCPPFARVSFARTPPSDDISTSSGHGSYHHGANHVGSHVHISSSTSVLTPTTDAGQQSQHPPQRTASPSLKWYRRSTSSEHSADNRKNQLIWGLARSLRKALVSRPALYPLISTHF